mmetsp:Transcript_6243/g.25305  ORF Transcript_6243/g.25305 Transcript_6243/m.25305 type:complete len:204 (+) Transcript_6243:1483-2094(+)
MTPASPSPFPPRRVSLGSGASSITSSGSSSTSTCAREAPDFLCSTREAPDFLCSGAAVLGSRPAFNPADETPSTDVARSVLHLFSASFAYSASILACLDSSSAAFFSLPHFSTSCLCSSMVPSMTATFSSNSFALTASRCRAVSAVSNLLFSESMDACISSRLRSFSVCCACRCCTLAVCEAMSLRWRSTSRTAADLPKWRLM